MKRMIMGAMVLSLAVGSLALADPPQGYDQEHHDEHHHVVEHHRPGCATRVHDSPGQVRAAPRVPRAQLAPW